MVAWWHAWNRGSFGSMDYAIGSGRCFLFLLAVLALPACASRSAATTGPAAASAAPAAADPAVSIVDASVVVDACPDVKWMNAKAARDAIRKLVDPCAMVPGGRAHFAAILDPDGKVKLASPSGDTAEGVVPTCVLQNQLQHKVNLKNPCKFEVRLEERPGTAPATSSSP